jgi:galactose mutarotase-like enzyme
MMPTIAACRYPGTNVWLPDHGELWTKPWDVTDVSDNSIATSVAGDALAYRFDRTVSLGVRSVHVAYRVTNEGTSDLHFLWAAHPLFSVLPTTKVLLHDTGNAGELREVGDTAPTTWPSAGLSVADALVQGTAKKLFARAVPAEVLVSLVDGDGGSLSLRWAGSQVPWVGIWLDNCSLSRRPVVAIEPTNAPDDSLEVAERVGQSWVLAPGATRRWSLDATVSGAGKTTP